MKNYKPTPGKGVAWGIGGIVFTGLITVGPVGIMLAKGVKPELTLYLLWVCHLL